MKKLKNILSLIIFTTFFTANYSQASCAECGEIDKKEEKSCCSHMGHYKKRRVALDLRYASTPDPKYTPGFTRGGFEVPKSQTLQYGLTTYRVRDSAWVTGASINLHSSSRGVGDYGASFTYIYGGLLFGRAVVNTPFFEVIPYALIGLGSTKTEVYGRGFGGKFSEINFLAEPTLMVNFTALKFLKVGAVASLSLPFAHIETSKMGDALGVAKVAKIYWSAGLQLTLGKFN